MWLYLYIGLKILRTTIYKKGTGGPRITDVLHITGKGSELLTKYPR